ncbi:MAG: PorP/SprF family type IX secretion system membrane protein [Flavobacteriaceae bacterium]|nr:PorP/SprF family type IX secretion system membrane protein [Flavobacteriaceae bacterium]
MKSIVVHIFVFFCFIQTAYSQADDGVVALDIPIRNSLTFNRYFINPTFSFVREQNKYITVTNKRELVGIEDAPNTYLFNYSGRIKENIGVGVGVFQQNYGILTTFGGIVNFAYNVRIQEDSNFTFGVNVGAYKSGLNSNKVITNFDDPALDNIPSNFLLTVNPGLNYGTGFMDFGLSYNNLITYNFNSSSLVEENPIQGLQGHIMFTGYIGGYGFFGDSKFSALARSEFQKETTIISGVVMLTVPKGIWAQVGYNTKYGASGGLGINITPQIAIEYNYEKTFVGLSDLGASHEITLAYRFKNNNYYDYSRDDELAGLINIEKKEKKKETAKIPEKTITEEKEELAVVEQTRLASEEKARLATEKQVRLEAEEQTRLAIEEQTRLALEEQTRIAAEEQARLDLEEKTRLEAEEQTRLAVEEETPLASEEKARLATEEQARLIAEEQAIIVAEEQARLALEEKARLESEEQAKLLAEEEARLAAEELVNLDAEKEAQENLIKNPSDDIGKSISELTLQTDESSKIQAQLIVDLEAAVAIKESDLKDLKEENDLSEQNIYVEPKPFKSISKENEAIELIKINLDEIILRQKKKITQLESLLLDREISFKNPLDEINLYYKNQIDILKSEQEKAIRNRESLVSSLEQISIATDFERKRRIKRAAYDNDQDRYRQDRNRLNNLKQNVSLSDTELTLEDLDFGRERNNNIQIIKNVQHAESGYYLVLAIHSDVIKRDEFLVQVISSGFKEVDFFFDVNTSEYYIYSKKFNNINETEQALTSKLDKPYNEKINIIKIEN